MFFLGIIPRYAPTHYYPTDEAGKHRVEWDCQCDCSPQIRILDNTFVEVDHHRITPLLEKSTPLPPE